MRAVLVALSLAATVPALAQGAAPPSGSGGGGTVPGSASQPRAPTGNVPPGSPTAPAARDAAGTAVIGHTTAAAAGTAGQTDGKDSGVRK